MDFTIVQNATLPLLKMQIVDDGIQDYNSMMKFIETSSIFFSMVNTETGIPKIHTKSAGFVEKLEMDPNELSGQLAKNTIEVYGSWDA
jgi:hypothetical protein